MIESRNVLRSNGIRWIALAATLSAILTALAASTASADPLDTVVTDSGPVRGKLMPGYREFAGIPYAAPPTGALRWQPPQPPAPWQQVRDATAPGPKCPQGDGSAPNSAQNEDCLSLNVWSPTTVTTDLPVMVWIHGGSFTSGAGSDYGAAQFMTQAANPMIVVTINYRLGALGTLAVRQLESPNGDVGNYGLEDQQAALGWVQRNIAAFGGNPNRVTIAGESAGGISICQQLASPSSVGLFQAAITESGPCLQAPDKAQAESTGATTAAELGCTDAATVAECLRSQPVSAILQKAPDANYGTTGTPFLPTSGFDAMNNGTLHQVPILNGDNHDEWALQTWSRYGQPGQPTLAAADYQSALTTDLGLSTFWPVPPDRIPEVMAEYPLTNFAQPVEAFSRATSDFFICRIGAESTALARRTPTYAYEFADPNPPAPPSTFPMGAFHASELPYLWSGSPLFTTARLSMTPAQHALSDLMVRRWSDFVATTGHPSDSSLVPLTADSPQLTSFKPEATAPEPLSSFDADHHCGFWATLSQATP
ncbi:carboxylesterase/lipase family protein [Nocardia sp. NPDC058058]|uniref:carboxylesterase/lipase family protein n=1 Tax=Nocardia sp. NPDC058058 TaxID=3346317 RepID=UPI0036D9642C